MTTSCPLCAGGQATTQFDVPEYVLGRREYSVVLCSGCGHSYVDPVPAPADLADYYAEVIPRVRAALLGPASAPGELVSAVETEKVGLVQRLGLLAPPATVLDVGFGTGGFLVAMSEHGWNCVGVEIGDADEGHPVWAGLIDAHYGLDALDSLPAETFALITLWHVLEHLPDPVDVLRRCRRLLQPGGVIVLAVPNADSLSARTFRSHWFAIAPPWHLHHFAPRTLHRAFVDAGLTVDEIDGFGEQAMYLMWVESMTTVIARRYGRATRRPGAIVLRVVRRLMAMAPRVLPATERRIGRPGAVMVVGRRNDFLEAAQRAEESEGVTATF